MAALTKNAISETMRDRAKFGITRVIFQNKLFYPKIQNDRLDQNAISVTVRIKNKKYFTKFQIL